MIEIGRNFGCTSISLGRLYIDYAPSWEWEWDYHFGACCWFYFSVGKASIGFVK